MGPPRLCLDPVASAGAQGVSPALFVALAARRARIEVPTLFPGFNHSCFHSADLHFRKRKMP